MIPKPRRSLSNRLQSVSGFRTNTFDAMGNLISDGAQSWTYDDRARIKTHTGAAGVTTYSVNGLGQRVQKANATLTTRYAFDENGRLLGEYDGSGVADQETVWLDDLPVAVLKPQPATPVEQVLDNGASGFATTGTWTSSTAIAGFVGGDYLTHSPGANAVGAVVVDNTDPGFSTTGTWDASTSVSGFVGANYRVRAANGAPPTAVVADNTDAATSRVGTWPASTAVGGYLGTNYQFHAAGTGANAFTWNVALAQAGTYNVYVRWTTHANRATNAPYTVATASGNQTVLVNQQASAGQWNLLGTWSFNAGTSAITLTDQANGYVIADAVMIVPPGAAPNTATWSATLPTSGNWKVSARWTAHPNRATNATYNVQTASGAVPVTVNQRANGSAWQTLGTWAFNAGTATVSLTDQANGYVVADAIKFEPAGAALESASWTPTLTAPTCLDVYARWTQYPNRTAVANYTITHQAGTTVVAQNQQANGGTWNLLGTFTFNPGQGVSLAASDAGYVIADAVKFTPSAVQPPSSTSGMFYVHADQLGSPRAITRPTDNAVVWRWDNTDAFGANLADEDPDADGKAFGYNLRFPGQIFDAESGVHYNYFRDYDPSVGRYVESDPIGLKGGINTYAYVYDSPLQFSDPQGLNPGMSGSSESCDWYAKRCAESSGTSYYYCRAAPFACRFTPPSPWTSCVRQCLQDFDRACSRNSDGSPSGNCVMTAHAHCWKKCPGPSTCSTTR